MRPPEDETCDILEDRRMEKTPSLVEVPSPTFPTRQPLVFIDLSDHFSTVEHGCIEWGCWTVLSNPPYLNNRFRPFPCNGVVPFPHSLS